MGTRSLPKWVIGWRSLSSKISNSSCVSPETSLPFPSITVAVMVTMSTRALKRRVRGLTRLRCGVHQPRARDQADQGKPAPLHNRISYRSL